MSNDLILTDVAASYGRASVLDGLSLTIAAGEFVSLLGASGCGKTTTLRVVSGFLPADRGTVTLGGRDLTRVPPNRRDIGLVFRPTPVPAHDVHRQCRLRPGASAVSRTA